MSTTLSVAAQAAPPALSVALSVADFVFGVAGLAEEEIVAYARHTRALESAAFVIRGACAHQIKTREAVRLRGGRGNADTQHVGVLRKLHAFAQEIGVESRTVRQDVQIYETFFERAASPAERVEWAALPKTFFLAALAAPDPARALRRIAAQAAADPSFNGRDAALFVKTLRRMNQAPTADQAETDQDLEFRADAEALRAHLQRFAGKHSRLASPSHKLISVISQALENSFDFERGMVFELFEKYGALTVEDICDDTHLGRERVQEVLDNLLVLNFLTVCEKGKKDCERGARQQIYVLKGGPASTPR
jgi:hypothetical protein